MIIVRRASERYHVRRIRQKVWFSYYSMRDHSEPIGDGLGALMIFSEDVISPDGRFWMSSNDTAEVVTYVLEGSISQKGSNGFDGTIYSGEFQHMMVSEKAHHSAANTSRLHAARIYQMWLFSELPTVDLQHEQKRFSLADRRAGLCVVASPDGRGRSMRLHEDAVIISAVLDTGRHTVYELSNGRASWLHVVRGAVSIADTVLSSGDSAGITSERAVSFTAREETEILLLDMQEQRLSPTRKENFDDRSTKTAP